jgi:hypothetical protein
MTTAVDTDGSREQVTIVAGTADVCEANAIAIDINGLREQVATAVDTDNVREETVTTSDIYGD